MVISLYRYTNRWRKKERSQNSCWEMERKSKSSVLWCWVWTLMLVHLNLCCLSPLPPSLTLSSPPSFLPSSLSLPPSPSFSLLPLSPPSQFLSVIQPSQTSAQKEALPGVPPGQDRHTAGQPRANGGEHWVHTDRDEGGRGSEARERVPRANAQGLVKVV